mmetsp:Transcript_12780/g.35907  ORF Transcript_12780/g.35907 Transcript_12780/m.35907 type:complete len:205 (-) Transcript_12780:160-774(-)
MPGVLRAKTTGGTQAGTARAAVREANRLHQRCSRRQHLVLEATAGATAAGLLELAALGADVGLGRAIWHARGPAKVLDSLARVLGAAEQDAAGASGGLQSQLIESQALSAGLEDAGAGSLGELQGAHTQLGDLKHADIVRDGADQNCHLAILALHELGELAQGERRAVHLGHEHPLEDNLVEGAVSAPLQEPIELHEKLEVRIV